MHSQFQQRTGRLAGALFAMTLVAAACSTQKSDPKPGTTLVSLQLSSPEAQVAKGTTARLGLAGIYSDYSTEDLTAEAAWSSADASIAAVSGAGEFRGVGVGSTVVRATHSGLSVEAAVVVTAARVVSLQVTPPVAELAKGLTVRLAATATFTDATTQDVTSQAVWSSSATEVVTIDGGVASAQGIGTAMVTAEVEEVSSAAALEVTPAQVASIEILPASPSLPLGTSLQLQARGHYTDNSAPVLDDVVWAIQEDEGKEPVVTVSATGLLETTGGLGEATITASLPIGACTADYGCQTSTKVTVTPERLVSLAIEPANLVIPAGLTRPYAATGTFTNGDVRTVTADVLWESSDPLVASISMVAPHEGLLTSHKPGSATVRATMEGLVNGAEGDVVATTTVTVSDAVLSFITVKASPETCREPCGSLALGLSRRFVALGKYSDSATLYDITDQVTWSSSDAFVAVVSNAEGSKGLATSLHEGTTLVTATCPKTLMAGSAPLLVTEKLLVSMRIEPQAATVAKGDPQSFTAMGRYTDNSEQPVTTEAAWTATNGVVVQTLCPVSAAALPMPCVAKATTTNAEPLGVATVTARMPDSCKFCQSPGVFATASLEITAAELVRIEVSPPADAPPPRDEIPARLHYALTATGHYSDGSFDDLTELVAWASSDTSVATVTTAGEEGRGIVQGWVPGKVLLTATKDGVTGKFPLTINAMELREVLVVAPGMDPVPEATHDNYQMPLGKDSAFVAWGVYTDQGANLADRAIDLRKYNISGMAAWEEHPFVEVEGDVALLGLHTGEAFTHENVHAEVLGHATLSAEDPHTGKRGETVIEAIGAVPVGLTIEPAEATIAKGMIQSFEAKVTYSDGSEETQTASCDWASSNPDAAYPLDDAPGDVKGIAPTFGTPAVITATLKAAPEIEGTAKLTVKLAELLSIRIAPADRVIPLGTTIELEAYGTFSDGFERPISRFAAWDSSDHDVVIVSNAHGSHGVAISLLEGTVTVTAVLWDWYDQHLVSGSTTLTVGPPAILSLELRPFCFEALVGDLVQYSAIAHYTDGGDADVTAAVEWSSTEPLVASIDPASGLATALAEGETIVQASDGNGATGSTNLTVGCRCDCTGCEACTSCQ